MTEAKEDTFLGSVKKMKQMKFKLEHTLLCKLFREKPEVVIGQKHIVKGKVRTAKNQSGLMFVSMFDGSSTQDLQLVIDSKEIREKITGKVHTGTCIRASGQIVKSPASGQAIEMKVETFDVIGLVRDPATYLPCVKKISMDTLREHPDMRSLFKTFQCIFRCRSMLEKLTHEFMEKNDFIKADPPIVVKSDCEGAGDTFCITTLLKDGDVSKIPVEGKTSKIDWKADFFGEPAFLTVSSQLQLEMIVNGMGRAYTMNPSFRAERSKTRRHLGVFTHFEGEVAHIEMNDLMDILEDYMTFVTSEYLVRSEEDIKVLDSYHAKGLIKKLHDMIAQDFARVSYYDAYDLLEKDKDALYEHYKNDKEFEGLPKRGDDLQSKCEQYLCEVIFKRPTFMHGMPTKNKSFYMERDPLEKRTLPDGTEYMVDTVQGVDLLVPGLGELFGASIRTYDYETLMGMVKERGMNPDLIKEYIDMRYNGTFAHGGWGMGFDRLVSLMTSGSEGGNIRDTMSHPVAYGQKLS